MKDAVVIREGVWSVPYRGVSEEDLLPPLAPELTPRSYKIYPYRLQELYHSQHVEKTFRTLEMENALLRVTVLPELGGRLLAYDKKANRDLFFRNRELTPVMAGLTGAWMRLGCEFNFPGSHSVTSNRPVSASMRKNPDGSASIIISDIEWCSGMEWKIELILHPASSMIRQISTLYNRTKVHNRGYFWTNGKIEAPADSEFIFPPGSKEGLIHPPMDVTRIHSIKLPGDNGVDLRKNSNIVYALPMFFKDLRTPFFGCYNRNEDAGLIHYAVCGDLPGRKVWTPGVGDDSKPTAQGGPDTFELQSGPLPLQTDFFYLEPGSCRSWNEYWIAYSGAGKITAAAPQALIGEKNGVYFLYAVKDLNNIQGKGIKIDGLAAGETFQLPGKPEERITADGIPVYLPLKENPVVPEYEDAGDMQRESAEVRVQKAIYRFSRGENSQAREACESALAMDADNSEALLLLGIDFLKRGQADRAVEYCKKAKRRNRRNPMIDYYLGMALGKSGNLQEAEFFLERALGSFDCRRSALECLAELMIAQDRGTEAEERIRFYLCGADGKVVIREENLRLLELLLARNPDSAELKNAVSLLAPENAILQCCRNDFHGTARQLLNCILDFRRWGVNSRKWEKLYVEKNPEDPIGLYLFCGDIGCKKAESLNPVGIFPDSEEVYQMLFRIKIKHPECKTLSYYLGVLAASFEDWDQADVFWSESDQVLAKRGLGLSALHRGDAKKAAEHYLAGFEQAKGKVEYKYFYEMMLALRKSGDTTERGRIFAHLPSVLEKYPLTALARFQYLIDCGKYEELLLAVQKGRFTLYEGRRDTVDLFIKAHLNLGEQALKKKDNQKALEHFQAALSYPLNLGVGRTVGRADMKTKYLICKALFLQGKTKEAAEQSRKYLDEIACYAYDYVPLYETSRFEEDRLHDDLLARQNEEYEKKLKEFSAYK